MMKKEAIHFVRQYTDASIGECVAALQRADGDPLEATKSLLTPRKIAELRNNLASRLIAPKNLDGPPSPDEARLMLYLQEDCQQGRACYRR